MSESPNLQLVADLKALLITERELLVTGRAREAAELIVEKTTALEQVEAAMTPASVAGMADATRRAIREVMNMARENAVYFEAIRNGLRSAISRLEGMHNNAYVGSYGLNGQKLAFPQATGAYRKKA